MQGLLIVSFNSLFKSFDQSPLSDEQKRINTSSTFNTLVNYKQLGVRILALYDGDPKDVMDFFKKSILNDDKFIAKTDIFPEETDFEKKYRSVIACIKHHNSTCEYSAIIDLNNSGNSNNRDENIILVDSNLNFLEYVRQQCPDYIRIKCIHVSCGYDKILEYTYTKTQFEVRVSLASIICAELKKMQPEKLPTQRNAQRLSANRGMLRSSSHSSGGSVPPNVSTQEHAATLSGEDVTSSASNQLLAALNAGDSATRAKSGSTERPLTPRFTPPPKSSTGNVVSARLPDSLPNPEHSIQNRKGSIDKLKSESMLNPNQSEQIRKALFIVRTSSVNLYTKNLQTHRYAIRMKWENSIRYYLVKINSPEDVQNELLLYKQKFDAEIERYMETLESGRDTLSDLLKYFTEENHSTTKSMQKLAQSEHTRTTALMSNADGNLLPYLVSLAVSHDKFVLLRRQNMQKVIGHLTQQATETIKDLENDQDLFAQSFEMQLLNLRIKILEHLREHLKGREEELDQEHDWRNRNADSILAFSKKQLSDNITPDLIASYNKALVACPEYITTESELILMDASLKTRKPLLFSKKSGAALTKTDSYVKLPLSEDPSLVEVVKKLISKTITFETAQFYQALEREYLNSFTNYYNWLSARETSYRSQFTDLLALYNKKQQIIIDNRTEWDQATKARIRELQSDALYASTIFVNSSIRASSGSGFGSAIRGGVPSSISITGYDRLFEACKQGLTQKFNEELMLIPSKDLTTIINTIKNKSKRSLLDTACKNGRGSIVAILLGLRASVTFAPSGLLPIFYAVKAVDLDLNKDKDYCVVTLMLKAGAVVNSTTVDNKHNTPLHTAASTGVGYSITHIVNYGINICPGSVAIHHKNSLGRSAINVALRLGHENVIGQFNALGIGIPKNERDALNKNNKDEDNNAEPIEAKALYLRTIGNREKLFLQQKKEIESTQPDSMKLASQKYASANSRVGSGIFGFLVSPRPSTDRPSPENKLSFKSKLLMKFVDSSSNLIISDNDLPLLNKCDDADGVAPIHVVCMNSGQNVQSVNDLTYLINKKVDINITSNIGLTALHYACENGREDLVKILLNTPGINMIADKNGLTPLHSAVIKGHDKIVRLLLAHLCPQEVPNDAQKTHDYATIYKGHLPKSGIKESISVAEKNNKGTKPSLENNPQTAFMKALLLGHKDVLLAFDDFGFVISDEDMKQWGDVMEALGNDKKAMDQKAVAVYGICEYLKESRKLCEKAMDPLPTAVNSPQHPTAKSAPPSPVKSPFSGAATARDRPVTPSPMAAVPASNRQSTAGSSAVLPLPQAKLVRSLTSPQNPAKTKNPSSTPGQGDFTSTNSLGTSDRSPTSPIKANK